MLKYEHFFCFFFITFFLYNYSQSQKDNYLRDEDFTHLINRLHTSSGRPYPIKLAKKVLSEYDYVVIGAGTSGSVVASRLSESGSSVLVLEAGGLESNFSNTPAYAALGFKSTYVKALKSVPQKEGGRGFVDNSLYSLVGNIIGGTSSVNGRVYNRGGRYDYDNWAYKHSAEGWSFDSVLPYFLKSESINHRGYSIFDRFYHSTTGPLSVVGSSKPSFLIDMILKGVVETGGIIGDYNGRNQARWGLQQWVHRNGARCSTGQAFLGPASMSNNLDILEEAMVHKILINDSIAYGVRYEKNGQIEEVRAKKEIILSAGVFNDPKILMLSGIGSASELIKHKITVHANLTGVGGNLQCHPRAPLYYTINSPGRRYQRVTTHLIKQYGKVARNAQSVPLGFHRTKFSMDHNPDVFFQVYPGLTSTNLGPRLLGFTMDAKKEIIDKYFVPNANMSGFEIQVFLGRPRSKGYVTLRSNDPHDPPVYDHNMFADPNDLEALTAAAMYAHSITETSYVRRTGAKPFPNTLPGCTQYKINTYEYFKCYFKTLAKDGYHVAGSCKMGHPGDVSAVVDPQLRVLGIKGLRVCDTSIMPTIVNANLMAGAVMIGEKCSDMIITNDENAFSKIK